MDLEMVSKPARVADPDEGISGEELQLSARNHGMPLEALRYDTTPPGLHYLLTHYDIPAVDTSTYRLAVEGLVSSQLTLGLEELRRLPRRSAVVTLECAGNGRARFKPRPVSQPWLVEAVGTARWTGTPLAPLLRRAGIPANAAEVVFTGADHGVERGVEQDYQRSLTVEDALAEDVLLAYEMNGAPLPPQHGFPLRLIVPGWYGMAHVKWLNRITVVSEHFDGFQMRAYRLRERREDDGIPLHRMEPRALLIPPGFPDFMSRRRVVREGEVVIQGRAWSGWGAIAGVEASTDGGTTWTSTVVHTSDSASAWSSWSWTWHAVAGSYVLSARARDTSGRVQPVEAPWNRGGFANNSVQRIPVAVV